MADMSTAPAVQGKRILAELEVVKRNQEKGARHDREYTESARQCHLNDERIKRIFLIEVLAAARKATLPCGVIE